MCQKKSCGNIETAKSCWKMSQTRNQQVKWSFCGLRSAVWPLNHDNRTRGQRIRSSGSPGANEPITRQHPGQFKPMTCLPCCAYFAEYNAGTLAQKQLTVFLKIIRAVSHHALVRPVCCHRVDCPFPHLLGHCCGQFSEWHY